MSPRNSAANDRMREAAKAKILDAARELFTESGYAGTTLAKIAQRAGVSVGLTVYYFRTKDHLVQALADRILHARVLEAAAAVPAQAGPDRQLAALIDAVLEVAAAEPVIIGLHLALLLQPGVTELLADAEHEYEDRLARVVAGVFAARGDPEPRTSAALLRATLMGASYSMVTSYLPLPFPLVRATMLAQFGLEPGAPPP